MAAVLACSNVALAQSPEFSEPWKNPKIALTIDPYERNEIDWDLLATDPRVVAIIHRATIGNRADRKYAERRDEAKKRGYKWGAYHFGKPGDPIKQADFVLETVQPKADDLMARSRKCRRDEAHELRRGTRFHQTHQREDRALSVGLRQQPGHEGHRRSSLPTTIDCDRQL